MAPHHHPKRFVVSLVLVSLLLCVQHIISAPLQIESADDDTKVVKLQYKTGQSYIYDFSSDVVTKLVGTSDDESKIKVKGQALLTARTPTEFILTVTKASFETPSGQSLSGTNSKLEGTAIGFTNEDGVLKCTVQLENDDATWSANIKRALISLFTNYAYREGKYPAVSYSELDVSGLNCQTEYTVTGNKYEKKRDLNTCAKRDGSFSSSQAVPYTVDDSSVPQTDATIKSDQTCTQEFSSGILQATDCTETHKLTAWSNGDAGALTTIKSSLKFVEESNAIMKFPSFDESREYKIFFDFSDEDKASASTHIANTITVLKDLCTEFKDIMTSPETTDKYLRLKKEVKGAPESGLQEAYDGLNGGSICADADTKKKLIKLYLSAVASAGSSDSITFFAPLYADAEDRIQRIFRLSLAFAVRPRDNALAAITKILNNNSPARLVVTSGGLGHQYCHSNPNCEDKPVYKTFTDKLADYVGDKCLKNDRQSVTDAIAGLQALGNLHAVGDKGEKTIVTCLQKGINRIKINALQAFRHDPCLAGPNEEARKVFTNQNLPAHIRVHAYIALSKCMTQENAKLIDETLKKPEEVDQVKNYVCTHARNTLDTVSAGRDKPALREIFETISCEKYDAKKDIKRYSTNLESSKWESAGNLGYSAEANVIYSPDSFIPKTLQANFTFDHAGRSYNFLEFAANMEGYEDYLESVFGLGGRRQQDFDAPASRGFVSRSKRAVTKLKDAPAFNEGKIKSLQSEISSKVTREEKGVTDFYIRVWGTTIATKTLTVDELVSFYKGLHAPKDKKDRWSRILINHDWEPTEQIPLASDEILLPTVSGLPLRLAVDGSVILSASLHSKFDENTLSLNANWIGSGTSLIRGRQTVGAGPIEAGLQLEVKSHATHNSGFQMTVKRGVAESTTVDMKTLLPQQMIRDFVISSKIYLVESKNYELPTKKEIAYKVPTKSMGFALSGQLTDLATSIDIKYPDVDRSNPDVGIAQCPLSGPIEITGKLQMADPGVKEITLLLDYQTNEAKDARSLRVVLDTPGSKVNRRLEANLKFKKTSPGNVEQEASIVSERLKAFLYITDKTAGTVNDKEIKVSLNGKDYGVKLHSDLLETEEQVGATTTTSKLDFDASYYTPGGSGTLIKGNALRSKKVENDKTSGKLTLNAETDVQKTGAAGTIEWEKQKDGKGYKIVLTDVKGNHGKLGKFIVNGKLDRSSTSGTLVSDFTVKYGTSNQHEVNAVANIDESKEGRRVYEAKLTSTRKPELNFDFKWERDFSADPKILSFTLNKGPRTIAMTNEFTGDSNKYVLSTDLKVKCTQSGADFNLKSKIDRDGPKIKQDLTIKSGSANAVAKLDVDTTVGKHNADINGNAFGQDFSYVSSLTGNEDAGNSKINIKLGDAFDLDLATDYVNSESKVSFNSVVKSNKFLTQPYTFRGEVYPETSFKNKEVKKVKKSLIQVLNGQDRITSFVIEKTSASNYKIELYQQNILEANFVIGAAKGAVVLDIDVNIPSKRRVISNLELKGSPAGFELTTEVKWDANKDPSKVLSLKSATTRTGFSVVSKNSLDISGEKRELNFETKAEPSLFNADHSFSVDYNSAKDSYSIGVDSRIDMSDKTKGTKLGLKVDLPGQKPVHFRLDSQFTDVDTEKYFFEYSLNYEGDISDDDAKDQFLKLKVSQRPVNGGRSVNIEGSGRIISDTPKGISLQIDTERGPVSIVKVKWVRTDADKKVAAVDASINHDKTNPEKTLVIKLTYDKFTGKPILNLDVKYLYTFNSFKDFQITEIWSGAFESISSSGENTLKINPDEFAFKTISRLAKGSEAAVTIQDFEINAGNKDGKYKILTDVRNLWTNPLGASDTSPSKLIPKIEIEVEPKLPNVKLSLVAERLPSISNFELKLSHDEAPVSGGQKRTTSINTKVGGQVVAFTSILEFGKGKSATDFSVKINNDPERKLSVLVGDSGTGPTAEASVTWGDKPNETIKTKGNVVKTANGGFDADLKFDKTPLTNPWVLKITRTVESDKKAKFVFNAESAESNQIVKISLDRNIDLAAKSSLKADYEIAVSKYVDGKHTGKFALDLDRPGRQLVLDFEGAKDGKIVDKTKIDIKATENEKRVLISSDCDKPYCVDANFGLKTTENAGSLEMTVTRDNIKNGMIVEGSKSADYQTLKADVQVFFAREKVQEDFAIYLYKEAGQDGDIDLVKADLSSAATKIVRCGVDIKLDDRTLSVVSGHGDWQRSFACQLNIWLDKATNPTQKFAWVFAKIQEQANARSFLLASRQPVHEKAFRLKSTRTGLDAEDIDVKLEFDIYTKKDDQVVWTFKRSGTENNRVYDVTCISEGLAMTHKLNCVTQTNGDSQTSDCSLSFKSPGEKDSSYKFSGNCSPKTKTVKFDQLLPEKKSYYVNVEVNDEGCMKSMEYILPGFTPGDARTVKIEKSEVPRGYIVTTSLKSEGDDFTELFLGQVVARGLGIKLTRTEKGAQNDLLEIRRVENSTYLRSYEVLWNTDNIKKSLSRLEAIAVQRSANFAGILKARADNVRRRHNGIMKAHKAAQIDVDPTFAYLKNQIEAMGKELRVDPGSVVQQVEKLRAWAKKERETIRENLLAKILDKLSELVASGKDTVPKIAGQIRDRIDQLSGAPDINLEESYGKLATTQTRGVYTKFKDLNEQVLAKQKKNPTFDKVAKMVRGQLASMYLGYTKSNRDAVLQSYPYPEEKEAYDAVQDYISQRIATPEKKTLNDDFREMMFAKSDAAWKTVLRNSLYTRFASGHGVFNLPIFWRWPFFQQLLTTSRTKKGLSSALSYFTGDLTAGYGMIYGTKEFRTFDGKVGSFSGPNQYLLASDFAGQKFSVAIAIQGDGDSEEKFVYVSDGKDKAVIAQDGTIFMNGKRSIRGAKAGTLEVVKEGWSWKGVKSDAAGVTVVCQTPGRFSTLTELPCIVRLNKYYHSKVRGVLGNYNNEEADDSTDATEVEKWILK